jgi:hypothetical protein
LGIFYCHIWLPDGIHIETTSLTQLRTINESSVRQSMATRRTRSHINLGGIDEG